MTIGNLVAIAQSNIRRLFGYSTIAHAGYLLVGVAAGVQAGQSGLDVPVFAAIGLDSVLFYLGAYTAANLTAFFAIAAISERVGSDRINDYTGLVTRSPALAVILALALIALFVISRYFEYSTTLFDRSLVFVGAGVILLAGGFLLERGRRRMLDAMRSGEGQR